MGHDLKVNGEKDFPSTNWREGILYFLFQIWTKWGFEDKEKSYRPKWRINFGNVVLRLHPNNEEYFAYGKSPDAKPTFLIKGELLDVSSKREDVEIGLARFAKNKDIQMLCITFSKQSALCLWKKEKRGAYGVHAIGVDESLPVWWS